MTLTFGGNTITCLQNVETSEEVDVQMVECAGATYKEKVVGLASASLTLNLALNQTDVTLMGYLDPADVGAIVFQPGGATAGYIKITSTNGIVTSRQVASPVNGIVGLTATIELDNLTVGAV